MKFGAAQVVITINSYKTDVAVIGGGPAGLAAALSASKAGASVMLVEREARLGGILKQCVHDGFGVIRFGEKLSGPEYAYRDIKALEQTDVRVMLQTFVTRIEKTVAGFVLTLISSEGVTRAEAGSLVLATGCRERTAKQIAIHGTRPAGVFTAGSAQYYVNILGQTPTKRCVILGSGDIGLIMARRLTLEGAEVVGVYEAKATPGGLLRNIVQCVYDFDIPLHMSRTVTRVFGGQRLEAVEICGVDENLSPIAGTEQIVECDALILSVGLIPENELAETLGVKLSRETGGPVCDQNRMTSVSGVFICGNAAHVFDLVDYVSQSGDTAGRNAARFSWGKHASSIPPEGQAASLAGEGQAASIPPELKTPDYREADRALAEVSASGDFLYVVPQLIDIGHEEEETVVFFRSREVRDNVIVRIIADGEEICSRKFKSLRPPEMERMEISFTGKLRPGSKIAFEMD